MTYTTAVHICRTEAGQETSPRREVTPSETIALALALHSSRERIRSGLASTGSPISGWLQIFSRGFAGALVGDDLIGDLLPFVKVAHAGSFDRADMHEHVGAAGVGLNEPEAFRCIEPFHCARREVRSSRIRRRT